LLVLRPVLLSKQHLVVELLAREWDLHTTPPLRTIFCPKTLVRPTLEQPLQAKVKGVVLIGFTRNLQDGGAIPNYPKSQTKVYCATGDLVCFGTLTITAAHLTYGVDASSAAAFLASKVG
jgi:hypothetical protein